MSIEKKLGKEVLVRKYKGSEYRMVIPVAKEALHKKYMAEFRPDLFKHSGCDHCGAGRLEVEVEHLLKYQPSRLHATPLGNVGVYGSEDMEISIIDDWQLSTELRHGFTTVARWDTAKELSPSVLTAAIESNTWIYAKSMPQNPHFYALRKKWDASVIGFDAFVMHIRRSGETHVFGGSKYRQLIIGDYLYWTMGAPLPITILINRKKVGNN